MFARIFLTSSGTYQRYNSVNISDVAYISFIQYLILSRN